MRRTDLPTWCIAGGTVLLIALLAACAVGGGTSSSLDDTVSCLESSGVSVSTDGVADGAGTIDAELVYDSAGVELVSNSVTIVFNRSEGDAKRTEARYNDSILNSDLDSAIPDVYRYGTVVVAWNEPVTEEDETQIEDCLPPELRGLKSDTYG